MKTKILQKAMETEFCGAAHDRMAAELNVDHISFGMVSLTQGQTIRLSVVNPFSPRPPDLAPSPSRVVLTFLDSEGRVVHNNNRSPVRKVVKLQAGKATFLDLNANDLQYPPGPTRLQLHAVLKAEPTPSSSLAAPFVSSVEVFNNANGRTVFFIGNPGVIHGFNPQPDPPLCEIRVIRDF
jgi:hypothetical protein